LCWNEFISLHNIRFYYWNIYNKIPDNHYHAEINRIDGTIINLSKISLFSTILHVVRLRWILKGFIWLIVIKGRWIQIVYWEGISAFNFVVLIYYFLGFSLEVKVQVLLLIHPESKSLALLPSSRSHFSPDSHIYYIGLNYLHYSFVFFKEDKKVRFELKTKSIELEKAIRSLEDKTNEASIQKEQIVNGLSDSEKFFGRLIQSAGMEFPFMITLES